MSIPKRGGYSGGRPASEMGPPANLPSATIKPFREATNQDCWCQPVERAVPGRESPDSPYVAAMRRVEARRGLLADVDLPAEYAKAAASVTRDLLTDLDYARADARHHLRRYESAEAELRIMREAYHDEVDKAIEFARQAREGEQLRVMVRRLVDNASAGTVEASALRRALGDDGRAPEGEYSWQCAHCGEIVRRPTLEAAIAAGPWHDKEAHGRCFCGKLLDEHPPGPPCPPPPPLGVLHG